MALITLLQESERHFIRSQINLIRKNTSLIRVDDAFNLAYTPIIPANWAPLLPTTVQEALDRIALICERKVSSNPIGDIIPFR